MPTTSAARTPSALKSAFVAADLDGMRAMVVMVAVMAGCSTTGGGPLPPPFGALEAPDATRREIARQEAEYQAAQRQQEAAQRAQEEAVQNQMEQQQRAWVRERQSQTEQEERTRAHAASEAVRVEAEAAKYRETQEARSEDPAFFVPTLSASICVARAAQQAAKDAIKAEYSIARRSGGGIIDKAEIHEFQGYMRTAEEGERTSRAYLKARKKAPTSCSASLVRELVPCVRPPWEQYEVSLTFTRPAGSCDDPKLLPFLELDQYLD